MSDSTSKLCIEGFCGMGGWSIGFYRQGYRCIGIDNVDVGYPYELISSDIKDYHPPKRSFNERIRVVALSPPCTEFSTLTMLSYQKGQRGPPNPDEGIRLVKEGLRVKDEANPDFWVLENVWGSRQYIEPILGKPILLAKPWVLWGNIPPRIFEYEPVRVSDAKISHTFEHQGKGTKHGSVSNLNYGKGGNVLGKGGGRIGLPEDFPFDPLRSWKRARIPVWLAQSIAKFCDSAILEAVET